MRETAKKWRRARGPALALIAAALPATQEPLAGPAAQKFSAVQYVFVTQAALALAAPFLLMQPEARRDFAGIVTSRAGWLRLVGLTAVGLAGLGFYNLSLSHAHPVVFTAAALLFFVRRARGRASDQADAARDAAGGSSRIAIE